MSDGRILPDCMIGPNDPCKGYVELNDRIADLERQLLDTTEVLGRFGNRALKAEQQLAEAQKDAERYQKCLEVGFPVRCQSNTKEGFKWTINGEWFGVTPTETIDATIRRSATAPESDGSPESPKE